LNNQQSFSIENSHAKAQWRKVALSRIEPADRDSYRNRLPITDYFFVDSSVTGLQKQVFILVKPTSRCRQSFNIFFNEL